MIKQKIAALHSNGEDFAIELESGGMVPAIDPVTMQPTGEAKRFRLATGAPVAASLLQPTVQRRKSATLSSIERSALMDELVDQLIALKRTVADVERYGKTLTNALDVHERQIVLVAKRQREFETRTLWQRLRWLWSGV